MPAANEEPVFSIISFISTWHIFHTWSYLLVNWSELLPEAKCELWKVFNWYVKDHSKEHQILDLDTSFVGGTMQKNKCKKQGAHTKCKLFLTLAETFLWRRSLLLLRSFVSGFRLRLVFACIFKSTRSSLILLCGFQMLLLLPLLKEITPVCSKRISLLMSKARLS